MGGASEWYRSAETVRTRIQDLEFLGAQQIPRSRLLFHRN